MRRFAEFLLLTLAAAGCGGSAAAGIEAGYLEADWIGADTGRISGQATAEWCEDQRMLQIRAIHGDTGLALALYPDVILSADTYPVVTPGRRDSVVPFGRVALRWFGATAINGFQGDSGAVVVERTDSGQLSGTVRARASSVTSSARVRVMGAFRNLTVVDATRGCVPPSDSASPLKDDSAEGDDLDTDNVD